MPSYVNTIVLHGKSDNEVESLMNQYVAGAEQNGFFLRDVKCSESLAVLIFDEKGHGGGFGGPGGGHGGPGGGHGGGFGGPGGGFGGGHGGPGGGHGGGFGGPGGGFGGQEF
ncbi:hypothetical protein ACLF8R_02170 [Helicobacter pylori]